MIRMDFILIIAILLSSTVINSYNFAKKIDRSKTTIIFIVVPVLLAIFMVLNKLGYLPIK